MKTSTRAHRERHGIRTLPFVPCALAFGPRARAFLERARGLAARLLDVAATPPPTVPPIEARPALRPAAPSRWHDLDAEPVPVRLSRGVHRRLVREYLDHLESPSGHAETGWIPVGRCDGRGVTVTGLLAKGPRSRASSGDFEIDHAFVLAALSLANARVPTRVVGLFHSHPADMDWNSSLDRETDRVHCATLAFGIGVYPVLVREPGEPSGRVLRSGLRATFYAMRAERAGIYVPCEVSIVEGPDETGWLLDHEPALAEAADTVLDLRRAGLDAALLPSTDEPFALDLIARASVGRAAVVRFSPGPGPISLVGQGRALKADPPATRLGPWIREALDGSRRNGKERTE